MSLLFGIHLGSLPTGIVSSYDQKTGILENNMMNNPAIFVPTLKRIVWGYESWWRVLKGLSAFLVQKKQDALSLMGISPFCHFLSYLRA